MDESTLRLIESRCTDHSYDVKALINEVKYLKAAQAATNRVSDGILIADVKDEINCEAIDYTFGTYGQPAGRTRKAFTAGAYMGIIIAARIVSNGK